MESEPIPIYGKSQNGKTVYTIYIDLSSKKAYRGYHKEINQTKYWFAFFGVLIVMRALAEISLPDTWLMKSIIIIIGIPVSIYIGKIVQRRSIDDDLSEVHLSEYMLENYIEQGKKMMVREIITTVIILIIAIGLCVLFLLHNWLISIAFSFFSFAIVGMLINSLSMKRWKFYKYGL